MRLEFAAESNDHGSIHVERGFGAVVFHTPVPFSAEKIEPDGVGVEIDNIEDFSTELNKARGIHLAFENGVLDALAEIQAGLGSAAESALSAFGGGGDVVGDEDLHGYLARKGG